MFNYLKCPVFGNILLIEYFLPPEGEWFLICIFSYWLWWLYSCAAVVDHEIVDHLERWVGNQGHLHWVNSGPTWQSELYVLPLGDSESSSIPHLRRGCTGLSSRPCSLSTCSHLVPYLGSVTFHSTVSQIYVPVKKNVKTWMALNSFNFNEKRRKLRFMEAPMRPFRSGLLCPVYQTSYHKPIGIKVDSDLKLYCQIRVVVKSISNWGSWPKESQFQSQPFGL